MGRLSQEERALLDALIKENGADKVVHYIYRTFTPTVIMIRRITPENAHEWVDLRAFAAWLVDDCQHRLRGTTPPQDPAPPDVQQLRPTDVHQQRPTEVQQPRTTELEATTRPPSPPPSTDRQTQEKRGQPSHLEDAAAHPESDDPFAASNSEARETRNRKRRHTSFFDEEEEEQASGSGTAPSSGQSGSSQNSDKPFDMPCSYCEERGIPCVPQKDVTYRAMACFQCSYMRVRCSHVPASRSAKSAQRQPPANTANVRGGDVVRRHSAESTPPGNTRKTRQSDDRRPKGVSSGPWLSSPSAIRKIRINGKRVEIAK